jgi:hypothetical protein
MLARAQECSPRTDGKIDAVKETSGCNDLDHDLEQLKASRARPSSDVPTERYVELSSIC